DQVEWPSVVALSPDGRTVAAGGYGAVRLWETLTGQVRDTLKAHPEEVTAVAFSPDGRTLVTAGFGPQGGRRRAEVKLWDLATGRERAVLRAHTLKVSALAFTADGRTLATGSFDGTVKFWATATGQELYSLKAHPAPGVEATEGGVLALAFSPDG